MDFHQNLFHKMEFYGILWDNLFYCQGKNENLVARRGARLLDEVERSGTRRLQTAMAWPRAAQLGF